MATIALYADKIKEMPGLIKDIKQCVIDYKSELSALKTKTLKSTKAYVIWTTSLARFRLLRSHRKRKLLLLTISARV